MRRIALVLLAIAAASPALAQQVGRDDVLIGDPLVGVRFGPDAEAEIRRYFGANPSQPNGLPPGIARNLERGKPLPPGIAKRHPPSDLLALLPAYPGHEILIADDDLLLVATATQVVVDILNDVL